MGYTLAEKIIMRHTGGNPVKQGDLVMVEPDFVVVHDIYTAFIKEKLEKMGVTKVWNPDKIAIIHDHLMPPCLEGDPRSLTAGYDLVKTYGIRHFHATGGITHQLVPELGYSKSGDIVFVTDSHTPTYGAVGCFSTGVGYTEMAAVWGTGQMWLRVPVSIKIQVDGVLPPHVYAKDIILRVLGDLGAAGGTYKSLEFCGSAIDALGIDGRMTIANMVVECGGKAALFAADEKCAEFCGVDSEAVAWVKADEDAKYERVLTYRAEDLEPVLSCPPYVDNVHPLSEVKGVRLDQVFIGSCTNGRLEDLRIAAEVMEGQKISPHVKCIVTPASNKIMEQAMEAGYIQTLVKAGALVTPPYCSFCEGRTMGLLSDNEVVLGTNNRNFLGRSGSPKAKAYLSSPEIAAVSAIKGEIADPAEFVKK